MKTKKNIKTGIYLFFAFFATVLFLLNTSIHCVVTKELPKEVSAKTYDRATGNLYLGLGEASGSSESNTTIPDNAVIIALLRYQGYGTPLENPNFQVTDEDLPGGGSGQIEMLTLATKRCNTKPLIIAVEKEAEPNTQTKLLAFSSTFANDKKKGESLPLNDANEEETSGIVSIAASDTHVFAAVKKKKEDFEDSSKFGEGNSGIALVTIEEKDTSISLVQTDAQNGNVNIKRARLVNQSTDELKIGADVVVTGTSATLYWDEILDRLYIGMNGLQTRDTIDNGARSVIVASVLPGSSCPPTSDSLKFAKIAPDDVFEQFTTEKNQIVGSRQPVDPIIVGAYHLRVMHTSTSKHYLIINGGISQTTPPGNLVFALPLVNNPTNADEHGTLAAITDPTFMRAASTPGELYTSDSPEAQVGTGPLPLSANDIITDIVVIGDTVFVSIDKTQALNVDPGIFYSQAQFDENGVIYRWTPWTKRAFPFRTILEKGINEREIKTFEKIQFFEVDAANGKIWAIDASLPQNVYVTNWTRKTNTTEDTTTTDNSTEVTDYTKNDDELLERINEDFSNGSFSALDLDASTRGLGASSPTRYTLFGGCQQVAFIKTSTSFATDPSFNFDGENIPFAQNVIDDFSEPENQCDPKNYLLTKLPKCSGCVKVLEFSRRDIEEIEEATNYFFAGTQNGLYVFSNNGYGFPIESMGNLDAYPFLGGSWTQAPNINGAVIDIKSSGYSLYVLTFETSPANPIDNKLYRVDFQTTVTTMFQPDNIHLIAQSTIEPPSSDPLSKAKMFFATQIVTATKVVLDEPGQDEPGVEEQLLLATNNGVYNTHYNSVDGTFKATNQKQARWTPVDPNDTAMYNNLFAVDNTDPNFTIDFIANAVTTVWPIQVADEDDCLTFEKSIVRQLSGSRTSPDPTYTYDPKNFNSTYPPCNPKQNCDYCPQPYYCKTENNFKTFDPITYFWTDGARRFFIIKRMYDPNWVNRLFVIPYDIREWMTEDPDTQQLTDPALQEVETFYWIKLLGINGTLLAGTDSGVVALQ